MHRIHRTIEAHRRRRRIRAREQLSRRPRQPVREGEAMHLRVR